MKLARAALPILAATGLAAAPLVAAPVRAPSATAQEEQFVGNWVVVALLIGALVPLALLLADDSDNDSAPTSP